MRQLEMNQDHELIGYLAITEAAPNLAEFHLIIHFFFVLHCRHIIQPLELSPVLPQLLFFAAVEVGFYDVHDCVVLLQPFFDTLLGVGHFCYKLVKLVVC